MDKRLTDFGKELDRPFEVHENCYDCAGFYDGCPAWPADKQFACRIVTRLPDVMPGTYGQKFPATCRKLPDDYWTRTGKHQADDPAKPAKPRPAQVKPHRQSLAALHGSDGQHLCACGAAIAKGRRCCDRCRTERRQESLRHRRIDAAHRSSPEAQERTLRTPESTRTVVWDNDTPLTETQLSTRLFGAFCGAKRTWRGTKPPAAVDAGSSPPCTAHRRTRRQDGNCPRATLRQTPPIGPAARTDGQISTTTVATPYRNGVRDSVGECKNRHTAN